MNKGSIDAQAHPDNVGVIVEVDDGRRRAYRREFRRTASDEIDGIRLAEITPGQFLSWA
jgi:hypothetical protein